MEQPREPKFYSNEATLPIYASGGVEKTLQSIGGALERIESTLLELKTLFSALDGQAFLNRSEQEVQLVNMLYECRLFSVAISLKYDKGRRLANYLGYIKQNILTQIC